MKDYTAEVHGCHAFDATGALTTPVYLSATFRHPAFRQSTGYDYSRVANPTRSDFEKAIALLEGGERAWALSSGMAAINLVFALCAPGDHVLLPEDLYGGTVRLANDIYSRYGIAHEYGALLVADNTFLSPHAQKPLTLGADIVVESATKYLCGHNDVICGTLAVRDADSDLAKRIELLVKSEGPNLSPMDSWLMLRSLKTLGVRVERQAENALAIAEWLLTRPEVTEVYYPGLANHPGRALHESQSTGYGGMISFKVKTSAIAQNVLAHLRLIAFAESLGGVESLLTYPLVQTHAEMPRELIARTGLDDRLLRLSVGLEDAEDLKEDLAQALEKAARA